MGAAGGSTDDIVKMTLSLADYRERDVLSCEWLAPCSLTPHPARRATLSGRSLPAGPSSRPTSRRSSTVGTRDADPVPHESRPSKSAGNHPTFEYHRVHSDCGHLVLRNGMWVAIEDVEVRNLADLQRADAVV